MTVTRHLCLGMERMVRSAFQDFVLMPQGGLGQSTGSGHFQHSKAS